MGTEGTGSRGCSAASGTAILSAACIALCLIVFVGNTQWRVGQDGNARLLLSRGRDLPLLLFNSLPWLGPGWTMVQQDGPQLPNTAEIPAVTPPESNDTGQTWSSIEAHETWTTNPRQGMAKYYVLRNVLVRRGKIVLFVPPAADGAELPDLPTTFYFFRPGMGDYVHISYEPAPVSGEDPFAACSDWVHTPANLYWIWSLGNIYHTLVHGVGCIFTTLSELGLLPDTVTRMLQQDGETPSNCTLDKPSPGVLFLAKSAKQLRDKRAFLFDGLGAQRLPWDDMEGKCLATLVLGTSRVVDFSYTPRNADELHTRTVALTYYRRYLFQAALAEDIGDLTPAQSARRRMLVRDGCGGGGDAAGQQRIRSRWRCGCGRPRVTLASRPPGGGRAILNEADIEGFIRQRYDVDFVKTSFSMSMWEAFALVHSTDVFLGMHGAGFTNLLAMHEDTTAVQLFPYGWRLPDGSIMREADYRGMAEAKNATYYSWVNPYPQHGHFRREDFARWGNESAWREHPAADDDLPRVLNWGPPKFWTYQDTYVDMDSLAPVLEAAFAATGILPRSAAAAGPLGNISGAQ